MEIINGKITEITPNGTLTITANYKNIDRFITRKYEEVEIGLSDGRVISPEQRKKAHCLINAIGEYMGELPEFVKRFMKIEFITTRLKAIEKELFSLSDCDVTTAKEFITFLIDFILEHEIPCDFKLREYCEDIQRYMYSCLRYKRCACCGSKAELHHVNHIGMGYNRNEVVHEGMSAMALCRKHHTECHDIGQKEFDKIHHFEGEIKLNKELCKVWKVRASREVVNDKL